MTIKVMKAMKVPGAVGEKEIHPTELEGHWKTARKYLAWISRSNLHLHPRRNHSKRDKFDLQQPQSATPEADSVNRARLHA